MTKRYSLIGSAIIILSISTSCVSLSSINKSFEKIEDTKIIKIWYDDGDLDSAGALVCINENKLIMFQGLTKKSFVKNSGRVFVSRIGDWDSIWKMTCYSYGYTGTYITATGEQVKSISFNPNMGFGKNSILNQIFDLEISSVKDVINNYDIILKIIENLPEDDKTVNFFNFSTEEELLESKKELFYYYDPKDDMEYWIGKIREGKPNLENINADTRTVIDQMWDVLDSY
ncbi:MAG: hypothetical protein LBL44_08680 [Treponema sp.]|jgi:hypothetical protein|nr:hypothetical protein [Treponema sp.]